MAGRNCAFPGCNISDYEPKLIEREKYKLYAIPSQY